MLADKPLVDLDSPLTVNSFPGITSAVPENADGLTSSVEEELACSPQRNLATPASPRSSELSTPSDCSLSGQETHCTGDWSFIKDEGPNPDDDGSTVGHEQSAVSRRGAASPTPTELNAETEQSRTEIRVRTGVVARDYLDAVASSRPAHTVWLDPLRTLLLNDQHVRFPDDMRFHLAGRELRRLLDHGFVTEKEAKDNWTPSDWERLEAFDESPSAGYPYVISQQRPKPTAAYREELRRTLFEAPDEPDKDGEKSSSDVVYVPPRFDIYIPPETLGLWPGDDETRTMFTDLGKDYKKGLLSAIRPQGEWPPPTKERLQLCRASLENPDISDKPFIPEEPLSPADQILESFAASPHMHASSVLSNYDAMPTPPGTPPLKIADLHSPEDALQLPDTSADVPDDLMLTPPGTPPPVVAAVPALQPQVPAAQPVAAVLRPLGRTETLWRF
ncbi:hypothetical protein EIP86_010447 [Pleurotus ostreatoroseus]|nr:hypothetical protein EIP86_010447 [Pleurotus ostreatoroseus]